MAFCDLVDAIDGELRQCLVETGRTGLSWGDGFDARADGRPLRFHSVQLQTDPMVGMAQIFQHAVPAPDPYFSPGKWFDTREGEKTFLLVWTKTLASR